MNVKCPYCGCCYEISNDLLKDPVGNETLGYGWWLRCCKCHKKWWLRNTVVERSLNTPLKADKQDKINRLSALLHKENKAAPEQNNGYVAKIVKYLVAIFVLLLAVLCYQSRWAFYDYISMKAKHLSESISPKVILTDVKYFVENDGILVTGNVINESKTFARVSGVKIVVFDGTTEVTSWVEKFELEKILPEGKFSFSSRGNITSKINDIRVEISVF